MSQKGKNSNLRRGKIEKETEVRDRKKKQGNGIKQTGKRE